MDPSHRCFASMGNIDHVGPRLSLPPPKERPWASLSWDLLPLCAPPALKKQGKLVLDCQLLPTDERHGQTRRRAKGTGDNDVGPTPARADTKLKVSNGVRWRSACSERRRSAKMFAQIRLRQLETRGAGTQIIEAKGAKGRWNTNC